MILEKSLFAKPLSRSAKFITALRITSATFMNRRYNIPAVLFVICYDFGEELNGYQKMAIADIVLSEETAYELKEFFIDIYNNEDLLLDFLNGKISKYYFSRKKQRYKSKEETDSIVSTIINENILNSLL